MARDLLRPPCTLELLVPAEQPHDPASRPPLPEPAIDLSVAQFDLDSCQVPRFDEASPLQLETRGVTPQTRPTLRTSEPPKFQSEFWTANTVHKNSVAAKCRLAGRADLADKLEHCHTEFTVAVCQDCHSVARFPNRCDCFFCAECQPRLAHNRANAVAWWTARVPQPKHVVLTMRNTADLTKGHVTELKKYLTRLRRRKFCENWNGGYYSLEVTNEGRGWHLHIHLLVDARWIDAGQLAQEWASITGGSGHIVKVKDCRGSDYLREIVKYCVKGNQLAAWTPEEIVTFIDAFTGVRTFGVFGSLYGARTEFAEWLAEIREAKPRCKCGSCNVKYYTEADYLMQDLKPEGTGPPRPRPPPVEPQRELPMHVAQNWIARHTRSV